MKFIYLFAFLTLSLTTFSRDDDAWKEAESIKKQYEIRKENLKFYGGYYLLTEPQLKEYFETLADTISDKKAIIKAHEITISNQATQINKLTLDLKSTQESLEASLKREDSIMSFWGETSKVAFATVMYVLVFLLIGIAAFMFLLFARSNKLTVAAQSDYEKLNEDYEAHKKRALEREMKINRELQTERNKNASRSK